MNESAAAECRAVIIDNHDSFTHNIAQYLAMSGAEVDILTNTAAVDRVERARPTHLVLSAGGGHAEEAADCGNAYRIVGRFAGRIPMLGVCLGHQILARHLGGRITAARDGRHGRISRLGLTASSRLLAGLPEAAEVMRYHSSVVAPESLPHRSMITSIAEDDNEVMSFESRWHRLYGVQFHPESIGTPHGIRVFVNFLAM
ncbi:MULTISPECIES: aminodeoxychorismate/anthranilate synthase component II [Streptomyces]|uniref:Para-aminobenzoate synthase n=1 Tax=Streptomyces sviceus (strain ATCC 29083 / DSM 924 / JCM 4929 / NBRC 13980 / NCIMB 11184 / NRRL 5439 / UC 5370) TaxID=463191 RepID=B5HT90_STRX2|nr:MULTISPECIES: aminodeoxychorismate/anthranilate synthase component II [Streptomyces]EDY56045.2 para-aminobenzoate synthase [Streptomyces sviceus ATCC 29083]MYT09016.1 aminodeoxychorismate/anthranilate synthase component II [Streptomyces sp. SID5470]